MKKISKKKIKEILSNKKSRNKFIVVSTTMLLFVVILLSVSFAQLTPISSVTIPSETLSYTKEDEGSWQITKSAKWISRGKARITIELDTLVKPINDYTDVILVLDTSGSMIEGRLNQVKADVNELINYTIPKGNNIALVTFSNSSTIITDFTNDISLLQESVNNLVATGETNYYQALVNVDTILKNYQKQDNRDCVVLFLTDGLPNVDTPNEVAQYNYLKSAYPYLTINGIQYEMGETPLQGVKNISDNQYIANMDNLDKFLYRAALSPDNYDTFKLTDYITSDYFNIDDVSSITSTTGKVSLTEEDGTPKVTWNLDGINSGAEAELTIDINLNEDLIDVGGVYPTNKNLSVNYKIGKISSEESSDLTPILADNYTVNYDENTPEGCTVSNMPKSKNESVFDTVKIDTEIPICEGYQFKEWQLITEGVEQVNKDYFIMPESNVTLRAVWSKLSISKSMDGTISKIQPLYQLIADSSRGLDTSVNFGSAPTTSNSGVYTMESTANDTYPVHYYRGILDNNNVLFANFCWKIVRTTSTGGVKLVYNGEPNEDGQCLSGRSNHVGYGSRTTQTLSSNYYYGTDYIYDSTTNTFSLSGDLEAVTWNATTGPTLIGKFTCKSASADGTCTTLYQVESYYTTSSAYVFPLNATTNYTQIGTSAFNSNYNSPADVGYMYDTRYTYGSHSATTSTTIVQGNSISASSNYYYGNDVVINEDGTYTLQNKTLNEDGETYTITDAEQKTWSDNYSTLKGYYTCRSASTTCSTVYYLVGTTSSYQYYVSLTGGAKLEDQKIVLGKAPTDNGDGTYTLTEPIEVLKKDWYTNYSTYKNYYMCRDLTSTTCENKNYITSTSSTSITYDRTFGYIYGNDVEWDGTSYTLKDTVSTTTSWSTNKGTFAKDKHYTCLNTTGTCTSVYYIHYFGNSSTIYYLSLSGVENIEAAKTEMFTNDENSTSSNIKQQVDAWYAANMTKYTDRLEDTMWCNDRTFYSGTLKSKDTSSTGYSYFGGYGRVVTSPYEPSVICPEATRDGFTVSTEIGGNGLLDYPVGLLTADELTLAGHGWTGYSSSGYLNTGQYWWSLSPGYFVSNGARGFGVNSGGTLYSSYVGSTIGVRPSVSLAPGTKSIDGGGTPEDPYIIE